MTTVFTEGPFHQRLLALLLADLAAQVIDGESRDSARSLARQHLVLRHEPVVYAIDADTVDANRAAGERKDLNFYFGGGAGTDGFRVVHFLPSMEVVLFDRPAVLERLIGRKLDPVLNRIGEIAPRAVLERAVPELAERTMLDRLQDLTERDLRELRTHPTIAAIREFVQAHAEPEPLRRSA